MKTDTKKHQSGCPVAFGLDIFGDRWTLLIIRDMLLHGKRTYSDFMASEEKIATNILASRMKHLEEEGVVTRARDPDNRRSFIYTLTDKGLSLTPVLLEIVRWSSDYLRLNKYRQGLLQRIDNDRDGLIAEIYERAQSK
jgi:DNA-binding HxlR family transcriptional regulator